MRTTLILAATALLSISAPAFAQDRTIPAGALDAVQPPIDWQSAPVPAFQGRSVADRRAAAAPAHLARHRGRL